MREKDFLTGGFEANRGHLRSVAIRMLGSPVEADDAVQEAWLRLERADQTAVQDLRGWLTTVVARVCLDMLRARKTRREETIARADRIAAPDDAERSVQIADAVGLAMLVVLETLSPAERVAFVLHDIFNLPFDDIAPVVSRSPSAARQLASRARRRVQGAPQASNADRERQRDVVRAFLAASQGGDFSALLAVLDPEVVLRADASAVAASLAGMGDAPPLAPELHGAEEVARIFRGRARAAQMAMVDGEPGLAIVLGGRPRMVFDFVVGDGRIAEISLIADIRNVEALDLEF
jgi:RNA polymerase sigma-70 factor (ECF subfamily)